MSDGVLYRPEITPETHERIISRAEARYREVLEDFAAWLSTLTEKRVYLLICGSPT